MEWTGRREFHRGLGALEKLGSTQRGKTRERMIPVEEEWDVPIRTRRKDQGTDVVKGVGGTGTRRL